MDGRQRPTPSLASGLAGFPEHLQFQLQKASEEIAMSQEQPSNLVFPHTDPGNAFPRQARSNHLPGQGHPQPRHGPPQSRYAQHQGQRRPPTLQHAEMLGHPRDPPPTLDPHSFPPLGSVRAPPIAHSNVPREQTHVSRYQSPVHPESSNLNPEAAQSFFKQASAGAYRRAPAAHNAQHQHPQNNAFRAPQQQMRYAPAQSHEFTRPPPQNVRLFNASNTGRAAFDAHSHNRETVMLQSDYMNYLASRTVENELSLAEMKEKEAFRQILEGVAQELIAENTKDNPKLGPESIRLKCYGSLASGFAVKGSDMDLLLMFPKDEVSIGSIEIDCRRMLEKAFLALGFGARLLTNTRVPILRVCQSPSPKLLENLRKNRRNWEDEDAQAKLAPSTGLEESNTWQTRLPPQYTDPVAVASIALAELEIATAVALPTFPARENTDLEFKGDVGIQCDINFTNYVAVHNTSLLRCYCKCDPRVRQMGVFVKVWAKIRKINTPYHGTLSSYGYILMLLHFLMNIARPPVIPNLQHEKKDADAWNNKTDIKLFEGFDIRFMDDENKISKLAQAGKVTANTQNVGSLLRDFFCYYSDPRGFHWTLEVVSIRTPGGTLNKKSKGWTEAKRTGENNQIKLRYLLAIEDPFEIEHNIARTVGHSGLVSIRDEFRRAWNILNTVQFAPDVGWHWRREDGSIGEDLLHEADDRGDLLRKDTEYHRKKERELRDAWRMKAETKAEEAIAAATEDTISGPNDENGMSLHSPIPNPDRSTRFSHNNDRSRTQLTEHPGGFQDMPRKKGRVRRVRDDSADRNSEGKSPNGQVKDEGHNPELVVENISQDLGVNDIVHWKVEDNVEPIPSNEKKEVLTMQRDFDNKYTVDDLTVKPGPVDKGTPRAWSNETKYGRWLIWRDKLAREGRWNGCAGRFSILNNLFPYDPLRPISDDWRQRQNALVRAKRANYFAARDDRDLVVRNEDSARGNQAQLRSELRVDSDKSQRKTKTTAANPAQRQISRSAKEIFTSSHDRPSGSNPENKPARLNSHTPEQKTLFGNGLVVPSLTSDGLSDVSDSSRKDSALSNVPHTTPRRTFSRHEDTYTDFVPGFPAFELDPRQLRDLAVIRNGGNGCARNGEEYDVEIDGEFGGGGWMGIRPSTTTDMVISGSGATRYDEPGRGDEEGLLNELPGL